MKEYYYYFRDSADHPVVTVCLLKDDNGVLARGISICSVFDNPSKKDGRKRARGRARKAINTATKSELIIRAEAIERMAVVSTYDSSDFLYEYKSEFDPSLNDFEKHLLKIQENSTE